MYAVAFAEEGKKLLSASSGVETVIKSWDLAGRKERTEAKGPGGRFLAIAISPDGKTIAAGIDPIGNTSEMDVKIWDLATGKESIKPIRHTQLVQAMAFSPDGKTLATGSSSLAGEEKRAGLVRLLDVGTGRELATLRGHEGEVRSLAFDRSGKTLATGAWDGTVKLWELSDPEPNDLWVKSADGALALRVTAKSNQLAPGDPVELAVTLKNLSDKPVNVIKPLGVPQVVSGSIDVRGSKGKLGYLGSPAIYVVSPSAFTRLGPGDSIRETVKLECVTTMGSRLPADTRSLSLTVTTGIGTRRLRNAA